MTRRPGLKHTARKARTASLAAVAAIAVMAALLCACASQKPAQARAAMEAGQWVRAERLYRQAYNNFDSKKQRFPKAEAALHMALCLTNLGMYAKAETALQNARRLGSTDPMLRKLEEYLAPDTPTTSDPVFSRIRVAPARFINSRRSEASPAAAAGRPGTIFFASASDKASGREPSPVTGMKNGDIFTVELDSRGAWSRPAPLPGPVNTDSDEGTPSLTTDGMTMYFSRASEPGNPLLASVYVTRREEGEWTEPEPVAVADSTATLAAHPAVSPDGHWLYFVSDMAGGFGGLDIWRVNTARPSEALNLGPLVNTPGHETFPTVANDSTLWFSSDSRRGLGGLDLFCARLDDTGLVTRVTNPGPPLNSPADDFGMAFTDHGSGYFATNRLQADGHDNIWSFEVPVLLVTVAGTVTDRDEEPISGAIVRIVGNDGSNQSTLTDPDGSYKFIIAPSTDYVMKAGAEGFLNQNQAFTTDEGAEDAQYTADFLLARLNKPQVLENIFYDFDKATLRPQSEGALDSLADMLAMNPYVDLVLEAHTDRKGTDAYNLTLSLQRAKSVTDYLEMKGIPRDRLTARGAGKSKPKTVTKRINRMYPQFEVGTVLDQAFISTLDETDREAADQINRRTEFTLIPADP